MLCYGTQDDRFEQLHILALFLVLAIVGSRCLNCSLLVLLRSAGASILGEVPVDWHRSFLPFFLLECGSQDLGL
jgi:hypothetical protein